MGFRWDASKAEIANGHSKYATLPASIYRVLIAGVDDRVTKSGSGLYLAIELEVVDGEFAGRKIWENINYQNPSEKAEELAWKTLASIATAIYDEPREIGITDMLGKVVKVKTKIEEWNGEERAKVIMFLPDHATTPRFSPKRPAPAAQSETRQQLQDNVPF